MVPKKKLDLIMKKVLSSCKSCDGEGCRDCKSKTSRFRSYARVGIPMDYWTLAFKDFAGDSNFKKIISEYLTNINPAYEDGVSLAFVGNLGTGKTYAACSILKLAQVSGYSVKYLNMSDIIDNVSKGDRDFYDKATNIDFLCIDEYDARWVYPSEKAEQLFGQTMERILRFRFQNKMPTIICSNTLKLENVLAGDFSRAVDSLFSKYVKVIYVSGKDFRKI